MAYLVVEQNDFGTGIEQTDSDTGVERDDFETGDEHDVCSVLTLPLLSRS